MTCEIPDCGRPVSSGLMCGMHHNPSRNHPGTLGKLHTPIGAHGRECCRSGDLEIVAGELNQNLLPARRNDVFQNLGEMLPGGKRGLPINRTRNVSLENISYVGGQCSGGEC
ncbi:hypothetical protein LVY72_22675 [Arthrobacter sp. I2-34]|uniref:HNH endonuclease n=1 Tax=Arthrobacter hankyongi TaxID=2904801 RepID=A0ABS9LDD8_9MICC|nr:hypothetical protein [Arthrobacter hankyongi]MCG2624698.1 hypothetical protein [Arthrobacter hankyongi]